MGVWGEVQEGFEGVDGSEVAERKDVGSLKDEDQVDVDGPVADPFEGGQTGADFVVGELFEGWQIQFTALQRLGEVTGVGSLLPAEITGFQFFVGQLQQSLRGDLSEPFAEFVEGCQGRSEGDLLFEDDVYQGLEGIGAVPHGRVAVGMDDSGQVRIGSGQRVADIPEVVGGEVMDLGRHCI